MGHTIIFVGLLDKVATNGETMKNQLFVQRFQEIFDRVYIFNAENVKHRPWRLLRLLCLCWAHPKSKVYLSASYSIAKPLLLFLKIASRNDIYYWVVGGIFHERVKKGELSLRFCRSLHSIIVQNEFMRDSLIEQGLNNVHYISNSKRIDFLPDISSRNNRLVKFVFLSRIHPSKGCKEIIQSAINLNNSGCRDRFIVDFYGKIDPCYPDFSSMIDDVPNVSYKGFLDLTRKEGYLKLSEYDVMLFPTYWVGEGFPGVIIDAYIAGLPVVASDWNLNCFYVTNETGIIIPHHNQEILENEMRNIIEGKYDLQSMSQSSQHEAMKYDNRNVITKQTLCQIGAF